MPILDRLRRVFLGNSSKSKQATKHTRFGYQYRQTPRDLPEFTFQTVNAMLYDPTIKLGLAARSAPIAAAELGYKEGGEWQSGVRAKDPKVAAFVQGTVERFWYRDLWKVLEAQKWGWSAAEVMYRVVDDKIVYDRILYRDAYVTQALTNKAGKVAGVRFRGADMNGNGDVDLRIPRALWHPYMPHSESPYGTPALLGSYSPWADKWFEGGALDVRRLFMRKDSYRGGRMRYPPGTTNIDGKGEVPNRDIAREIVEQMLAGNVETLPSVYDMNGNLLWAIEDAAVASNPQHILQFPKDLDVEMLRGIGVPDDVLTSEGSGAWQGKQVPMLAFYANLNLWVAMLLENFIEQVVEPLVFWNFGAVEFSARMKPLEEQAFDRMNSAPENEGGGEPMPPGMPPGQEGPPMPDEGPMPPMPGPPGPPPQRMSLEESVGRYGLSVLKQQILMSVEGRQAYQRAREFWNHAT